MRYYFRAICISSYCAFGHALAFSSRTASTSTSRGGTSLYGSTGSDQAVATKVATVTEESISTSDMDLDIADIFPMPEIKNEAVKLSAEEINTGLAKQLTKMKEKDQTSKQLQKEVGTMCSDNGKSVTGASSNLVVCTFCRIFKSCTRMRISLSSTNHQAF